MYDLAEFPSFSGIILCIREIGKYTGIENIIWSSISNLGKEHLNN